jgi:hypothetical protein
MRVRMPPCFNRGMKDVPPRLRLQEHHACGMLELEKMFYTSFEGDRHGQANPDNG